MSENNTEYAFLFKNAIDPLALMTAQAPLRSTIITGVVYRAGVYYVIIHANNDKVIQSYIDECKERHDIVFNKMDIDTPYAGCFSYSKAS